MYVPLAVASTGHKHAQFSQTGLPKNWYTQTLGPSSYFQEALLSCYHHLNLSSNLQPKIRVTCPGRNSQLLWMYPCRPSQIGRNFDVLHMASTSGCLHHNSTYTMYLERRSIQFFPATFKSYKIKVTFGKVKWILDTGLQTCHFDVF